MRTFERPKVVVSKCLGFEACRYNGENLPDPLVRRLESLVEFVPVCPEVEIGLGVPRPTLRVVLREGEPRLLQPETGRDLTGEMVDFSRRYLAAVGEVDGFLLKSRSPSCGLGDVKVYATSSPGAPCKKGSGVFGAQVREAFPLAAVEDEGRLKNFTIRDHFLTRLYAHADLRRFLRKPSAGALVRFQAAYKLLLLAYNQKEMRILGRLVANPERRPLTEIVEDYALHFRTALHRAPRHTSHLNVLQHAAGYFKDQLLPREKRHFETALERYRDGRAPLSVPVALVRSWVERFETGYLEGQVYFEPYPEALVEITDSGKGRDH